MSISEVHGACKNRKINSGQDTFLLLVPKVALQVLPSLPLPMAARGSAGPKSLDSEVLLQQQMAVVEQQLVFEGQAWQGRSKTNHFHLRDVQV